MTHAKVRNRTLVAAAAMVGTVIGVGIFGVPYAISRAGVLVAVAYFIVLGGIQLLQNLFFADAAIACPVKSRLVGLAGRFLGGRARKVAAVSSVLGFWAGLIAYVLVGGSFLHLMLSPVLGGDVIHYQLAWGVVGMLIVYRGLGFVNKIEFAATVALVIALLAIAALSVPHLRAENFQWTAGSMDFFLPYGIILFSLSGASAVLEMKDIIGSDHRALRRAIVWGSVAATALTVLFAFMVYGVTGLATTQDAVAGLKPIMGGGITFFAAAFGFLAVITSYFIIGLDLQSTFQYDYKMRKPLACALSVGMPVIAVLVGVKGFVNMISFSGAVFGGISAVIICMLYVAVTRRRLLGKDALGLSMRWAYVSGAVLILGAAYEVWDVVKGWF